MASTSQAQYQAGHSGGGSGDAHRYAYAQEAPCYAPTTRADPPQPSVSQLLFDVRDLTTKTDVGRQPGVKWSLSSFKPGNGVQDLLHPDIGKLWQSDGTQPHFVNIQFPKRTAVTHVAIYLDHKLDDSYTPTKILIKGGTYFHDLVDIRYREFTEPSGWKFFVMVKTNARIPEEAEVDSYTVAGAPVAPSTPSSQGSQPTPMVPIHAWLLQICILGNHLNGKDTHVRGVHIFGPPAELPPSVLRAASMGPHGLGSRATSALASGRLGQTGAASSSTTFSSPMDRLEHVLFSSDSTSGSAELRASGTRARNAVLPPGLDEQDAAYLKVGLSGGGGDINGASRRATGDDGEDDLPALSRTFTLGASVR